jgi:acyl-CoA synthetase (AMP-forming)/AMP-acid ligase II
MLTTTPWQPRPHGPDVGSVVFVGYWNNPKATVEKFVEGPEGRWLFTGDRGVRDEQGRLRSLGRDDDIIGSGGYRIGPAEVEDCLLKRQFTAWPDPGLKRSISAACHLRFPEAFTNPEFACMFPFSQQLDHGLCQHRNKSDISET